MTIAELHGKLAPHRPQGAHERLEDLLTSDVFGTMKYVGLECGFLEWLGSAVEVSLDHETPMQMAGTLSDVLPAAAHISSTEFRFWPTLPNGREPDLLLVFRMDDGRSIGIMVEAKYFSGPSDYEIEGVEDSTASDERETRSGNQIADQVNEFWSASSKLWDDIPRQARYHLYVTTHYAAPLHVYGEAGKHLARGVAMRLYWLSWHRLLQCLNVPSDAADLGRAALVDDLRELLKRKRLRGFEGYAQLLAERQGPVVPAELPLFFRRGLWNFPAPVFPGERPLFFGGRD